MKKHLFIIINIILFYCQASFAKSENYYLSLTDCKGIATKKNLEQESIVLNFPATYLICSSSNGFVNCLNDFDGSEYSFVLKAGSDDEKIWEDKETKFILNLKKKSVIKTDLVFKDDKVVSQICKGWGFSEIDLSTMPRYDLSKGLLNLINELEEKANKKDGK